MRPLFAREKTRKGRSELSNCMSEWACECVPITSWSRMTIRISSCSNYYNIWIIDSFFCDNLKLILYRDDSINSFPIMESDLVTIFRKYFLEYLDNLSTIIRNRKNTIICFALEWYVMWLEPFSTFFRRELSECFFYKISSSCIFREEYFFVFDTGGNVTTTTSRNYYFFSWTRIFLEYLDMIVLGFCILEYRRCGHESSSSSSYDGNLFHSLVFYVKTGF